MRSDSDGHERSKQTDRKFKEQIRSTPEGSEKKIGILGFSFKANTNDTRESAAIQICMDLLEEGAELLIHDPKVSQGQIALDLKLEPISEKEINSEINPNSGKTGWRKCDDIYSCFKNVDAVLILTEWREYAEIDWNIASKLMRKPAWVFDSRSITNQNDNPCRIKATHTIIDIYNPLFNFFLLF